MEDDPIPPPDEDVLEEEEEEEEVLEVEEEDGEAEQPRDARLCPLMSNAVFRGFESHVAELQKARKRRRESLAFKNVIETGAGDEGSAAQTLDELDGMGVRIPEDSYQGDCNMRTLQKLLARVDARGFERCAHRKKTAVPCAPCRFSKAPSVARRSAQQLEFHEAFCKAAARVVYKGDWETDRPVIMEKYGWTKSNSEVLISTPRRFGKTYRCVCLIPPPLSTSFPSDDS